MNSMGGLYNFIRQLLAVAAIIAGGVYLGQAVTTPSRYSISGASAVQITQVYSEATFYGVVAIGLFLFGFLIQVSLSAASQQSSLEVITTHTSKMSDTLVNLEALMLSEPGKEVSQLLTRRDEDQP